MCINHHDVCGYWGRFLGVITIITKDIGHNEHKEGVYQFLLYNMADHSLNWKALMNIVMMLQKG